MRKNDEQSSNNRFAWIEDHLYSWIHDLAGGLRFFTCLPVPRLTKSDNPVSIPNFQTAARVLPLVGVVAALPMAVSVLVLSFTNLPFVLIAGVSVAVSLMTTGAFHEDGLADVADGFGGGHNVARKLEIMRDSRIGTYGASTLIVALLLRIGAISALIDHGGGTAAVIILIAGGLSRTLTGWLWHLLPSVRGDGKSTSAGQPTLKTMLVATGITAALLLTALFVAGMAQLSIGLVFTIAATAGFGVLAKRQIDGQTGDVLGASQQIAELAFLIGLLI